MHEFNAFIAACVWSAVILYAAGRWINRRYDCWLARFE